MANKWHGHIGFSITAETPPGSGVYRSSITERSYHGEVYRDSRRWAKAEGLNDDLLISNQISLVSDVFALENLPHMRYITMYKQKWCITDIEVNYPRIVITMGGLYHDETET